MTNLSSMKISNLAFVLFNAIFVTYLIRKVKCDSTAVATDNDAAGDDAAKKSEDENKDGDKEEDKDGDDKGSTFFLFRIFKVENNATNWFITFGVIALIVIAIVAVVMMVKKKNNSSE